MGQFILGIFILIIGLCFTTVGGFMTNDGWDKWKNKSNIDLPSTSGILTPDNKPLSSNKKIPDLTEDSICLHLGDSIFCTNKFPHTVIQIANQPILIIDKKDKNILVSAKFFSEDLKIIAELKENKFFVNTNNYFRIERPNDHILTVYDQQGQQALNINFSNQTNIKLLGRFYLPGRPPLIIEEKRMYSGGLIMGGNIFVNNKVDIAL
ncbi:hypothetical protein KA005_31720 [bacterium]|nr:hypothetical protein [bacterium]